MKKYLLIHLFWLGILSTAHAQSPATYTTPEIRGAMVSDVPGALLNFSEYEIHFEFTYEEQTCGGTASTPYAGGKSTVDNDGKYTIESMALDLRDVTGPLSVVAYLHNTMTKKREQIYNGDLANLAKNLSAIHLVMTQHPVVTTVSWGNRALGEYVENIISLNPSLKTFLGKYKDPKWVLDGPFTIESQFGDAYWTRNVEFIGNDCRSQGYCLANREWNKASYLEFRTPAKTAFLADYHTNAKILSQTYSFMPAYDEIRIIFRAPVIVNADAFRPGFAMDTVVAEVVVGHKNQAVLAHNLSSIAIHLLEPSQVEVRMFNTEPPAK